MNKRKNIRKSVGLPDSNEKIPGAVSEDETVSENTVSTKMPLIRGNGFFYQASGGATSPNTEVNSENQGVASEVPRKVQR
jgi:hypothetical protein